MKSRIYFPKRGKQRKMAKIKRTDRDRRAFKRAAYGNPVVDGKARYRLVGKIPVNRKPIAKVSERQKKRLALYRDLKARFLAGRVCEICERFKATDTHHRRGRAGLLLNNTRHWMALCRSCHRWIHDNIGESRSRGYIEKWGKQTP